MEIFKIAVLYDKVRGYKILILNMQRSECVACYINCTI